MKKEYELLEKFRTDPVTIQPSLQKPKKSGFKEWTFLEIVGCIFSISLIVYGSYNMIFPPTESESAVQQVQWEANPSKRNDLVSTDQQYKDNYELDRDINKNLVENDSFDKVGQQHPFKKLVLDSAEASDVNQLNIEAQAGGDGTQQTASSSGSTSQANTSTQRTSTQSNATGTEQSSSTASTQSNSTTSTSRSSTANTQSGSSQTSAQSTQPRRSYNSATYQPSSSSSDYYTYNSYNPSNSSSSSSSSPSNSSGSYNTSTYGDSSNSRLVVVQPTNVSNEPGMIAGTP